MSFSYNEELVLESNPGLENLVSQIDKNIIIDSVKALALEMVTTQRLTEEFKGVCPLSEINGEHVKNFFVIGLNGIELLWKKLRLEESLLSSSQSEPLYENIFTYLEELVDEINFDALFEKELGVLN